MAKNKTTENKNSVTDYIASIGDEKKRKDFSTIVALIEKQTRIEPKMWGTAIVGFGSYHYVYESGREGDAPCFGMAARANAITLYLGANFENRDALLTEFGKYKSGKGCVYIQKLEDIDIGILVKMVKNSMAHRKKHNTD